MFGTKLVTNDRIAQTSAPGTPMAQSASPSTTATTSPNAALTT